jgi:D-hydroxyproline dehydrogenase subunit gamma
MPDSITLSINGQQVSVPAGTVVASAIATTNHVKFRKSIQGTARAPLCGMGICFECRVTINGAPHQRSCNVLCAPGMEVRTDA